MVSSSVKENTKHTRVRYGRYDRVRTFNWVHPQDSQTLSFRGFFVCVREHKPHPGALWQGQNLYLSSSAGFPNVELSWILRLCKRTQSETQVRYGRVRTFHWVHPRDSQMLNFRGFFVCVREHKAHPGALWPLWQGQNI